MARAASISHEGAEGHGKRRKAKRATTSSQRALVSQGDSDHPGASICLVSLEQAGRMDSLAGKAHIQEGSNS